ncbi:beta-ketoacyl-ACP synthase III [Mycolicibacter arupensis]|uniref:Beta-ketoacyl-[acyl-carrier-protein] synthase III n=1 Tax=Mycolicibacter arupensis TaxID=342002 RepID=A0A0F5MW30_9MYCO|nr:beta-ketoacyl-ACP synthase III [Mycolicibacter arupensis]KKB99023.1 3-oxoacyl-ACP synthase [Mycolicibacter arupensis]MCV7276566.1 ketoacyl-ACP synthase III [Mycolicibacter arupensis]OQZ95212.1 ketoacyl-ACP synthase III [Mycolicibacter arupensis]TXI56848.1 MAG: ketoacyl-ACP synthase III [Mycolicibacter arupensis]
MSKIRPAATTRPVGLLGVGAARPARVVTNDEICRRIDSSDEWIYSRTGIKTRRFAGEADTVVGLAIEAGRNALAQAGLDGAAVDAVIVATSTNFRQTPSCAPSVAVGLGAAGVPAFDVATGCAGFGYALSVAADLLRGHTVNTALVIGSEVLSPTIDMTDRSNCFIFGDGAGAVVIGETPAHGIGATVWGTDGENCEAIRQDIDWISYTEQPDGQRPFLRMDGSTVFRWAAYEMSGVGKRAIAAAGLEAQDIDVFIPHQANARINALIAKSLELRSDVVIANDIENSGNTSAASIPLAMEQLLAAGSATSGDLALLLGYGSGLSYAASVVVLP